MGPAGAAATAGPAAAFMGRGPAAATRLWTSRLSSTVGAILTLAFRVEIDFGMTILLDRFPWRAELSS